MKCKRFRHNKESKFLYENYHNKNNGRLKLDMSLHAEYTTTPRVVREVGETAKEWGLNVHIHLSETKLEHEECKQRREGMTPTEFRQRVLSQKIYQ